MFYGFWGDYLVNGEVWGSGRGLVVVVLSWFFVVWAGGGILDVVYWVGALSLGIDVDAGVISAFRVCGVVCVYGWGV